MPDIVDLQTRSRIMSRIKARDTKPEKLVRSFLHKHGLRFRLHAADLPGTPDIVLPRHKAIVFVNGCFWHRHLGCRFAYVPKTRIDFWNQKFEDTIRRDQQAIGALSALGWHVRTIWECEIDEQRLIDLLGWIRSQS
jgi:DNA mismatch endonuclease (patch repair protein)